MFVCGTVQRPVRRFLPATSASLRWRGAWERWRALPKKGSCTPSGSRCRSHDCRSAPSSTAPCERGSPGRRMVQPPCCVPHRHARRRDRGKTAVRSDAPPFPPFRRRETIFRAPGASRFASPPHAPRRPRLAATPCGVSAAGWEDCRHGVEGWGKCGTCFLAARACGGAWVLGSSPRMTERRRGCQPLCRCGIRLPCFSPNPLFFRHPRA